MRSPLRIGFHVIYEFAAVPPIHTMRTGTADSHFALAKRSDNYKCGNDKNNNGNYLLWGSSLFCKKTAKNGRL